MAIALDTTAHPTGTPITAAGDLGAGNPNLTASVSTAAGGRILVVKVFADCGTPPFPVTVSGGGLTWTQRKTGISSTFLNASGVSIWTAFAPSTLTAQTITAAFQNNTSTIHYSMAIWAILENTVGFTGDTAVIGATASLVDDTGSNVAIHLTLTPQGTGSWLFGVFSEVNDGTALTADSNTSAFDFVRNTTDSTSFGRYKVSGTVATTTAATPVTFGSSTSDAFTYSAAIEIKIPSTAAALAGGIGGQGTLSGALTTTVRLAGAVVGAAVLAGALTTAIRLGGGVAGYSTLLGRLGPDVFPLSVVMPVSTTQAFAASPVPTWAVREGAPGGSITAGTGGAATYTAPATPGTYHVTATAGGAVTTIVVTVIAAPANATVRLDSPLQVMDGFGCAQTDSEPALITDPLADLLYTRASGIGLTIHRVGIRWDITGPRHDPTDYATFAWDLWGHVQKSAARGCKIICAPWTPPAALKDNSSLLGGHLNGGSYTTWANSLASFVTLAAQQSPPIPIYAIGPQNEPDFTAPYDSCIYSAAQMRDFIKSLGAALSALPASQRPRLLAPEPSDPTLLEGYLSTLEADTQAWGFTSLYATHQYGHATMPAATRAGAPQWMTEMSGLAGGPEATWDPTIADGLAIALWVHSAIASGNATAWVWLFAISEYHSGALPYVDPDNEALILTDGNLTPSPITQFSLTKRLFTIGNFSKFVRPGYQRTNLIGSLPANVSATAYRDPVSGQMVVVCINNQASTASLTLTVAGGSAPGALTPWVTSGTALGSIGTSGNLEQQTPVSLAAGTLTATLAANSVTTFVAGADLAGAVGGAAVLSGALTTGIQFAGSIAGQGTLTGALTTAIKLAGSIGGAAALTGSLNSGAALAGGLSGVAALSGALTTGIPLAGSIGGTAVLAGALTTGIPLAGSVGGLGALAASLTTGIRLAGAIGGVALLQGGLAGQAAQLAGSVAGAGALTAALSTGIPLSGSITASSSLAAALSTGIRLGGSISGAAALAGVLGQPVKLARGVVLRGQPTAFATLKGQAGFPVLPGQGDF